MKAKQRRIGTSTPFSNHPAVSLLAPHSTARTRILHTLTPQKGATNCTLRKEKERHSKVGALFFLQKVTKAKERGKEKEKANRAKAKAIAKGKAPRAKHLKVLEGVWTTRATSASRRAITKHNAPSLLHYPRALAMAGLEPSSPTRRSTYMTYWRTRSTRMFVPTASPLIAIGTLAPLQWKIICSRNP